jgi:hypothetical protein
MREPQTIEWNLPISVSDFNILKTGFRSGNFDDKWAIDSSHLHESDAYSVAWSRSWTGHPHYILIIKENLSGTAGPGIESMIYESFTQADIRITAHMAKEEVICLARINFGCKFKEYPEVDMDKVFVYPLRERTEREGA